MRVSRAALRCTGSIRDALPRRSLVHLGTRAETRHSAGRATHRAPHYLSERPRHEFAAMAETRVEGKATRRSPPTSAALVRRLLRRTHEHERRLGHVAQREFPCEAIERAEHARTPA